MTSAFRDHRLAPAGKRVFLLGATGTIGRATAGALVQDGHEVVCFVRPRAGVGGGLNAGDTKALLEGAEVRFGAVTDPQSLARDGFRDEPFDVLVSCLASRTGAPQDAWQIDYQAQRDALIAARKVGVGQMVLLSAICVQKPRLAFQHAKLAFEETLIESGLTYSIVRPTAFFKSLSGQIDRLAKGKPFLLFGDGTLTACKPISDGDVARFIAECIDDPSRHNRVLPVGGPGEAVTPRQLGEHLFSLMQRPARFRQVPVALIDIIASALGMTGRVVPSLAEKAEFARIARYYATESMLVLDPVSGRYDANATPSYGSETLFDHYARVISGETASERGDHAVF
ncbi:MAG: NAD(P)H-binding protein [Pseudomonadota bacterium]